MSLSKKDISKNISSRALVSSRVSNQFLNQFLDLVKKKSYKQIVQISNFGSFSIFTTKERQGRNPKTKKDFPIPKYNKIKFKPSNKIRRLLNT